MAIFLNAQFPNQGLFSIDSYLVSIPLVVLKLYCCFTVINPRWPNGKIYFVLMQGCCIDQTKGCFVLSWIEH